MSQSVSESTTRKRRRAFIIAAAADILTEGGRANFTFEAVANRAGLSRRTIFNYYPTIDSLIADVGAQMLGGLTSDLATGLDGVPATGDSPRDILDEIAAALERVDLVAAIHRFERALAPDGGVSEEESLAHTHGAVLQLAHHFATILYNRHPDVEPFDIDVAIAAVAGGVITVHEHWYALTGAADTPESRYHWNRLMDRLLERLRDGHQRTRPSSLTH